MSRSAQLLKPPTGDLLEWVTSRPEELSAYLQTVYVLSQLKIIVISGGIQREYPVDFSGENASVTINLD